MCTVMQRTCICTSCLHRVCRWARQVRCEQGVSKVLGPHSARRVLPCPGMSPTHSRPRSPLERHGLRRPRRVAPRRSVSAGPGQGTRCGDQGRAQGNRMKIKERKIARAYWVKQGRPHAISVHSAGCGPKAGQRRRVRPAIRNMDSRSSRRGAASHAGVNTPRRTLKGGSSEARA